MKKGIKTISALLAACLFLTGCLFGAQSAPLPDQTQSASGQTTEEETSQAAVDDISLPETAAASSEAAWVPETTTAPTQEASTQESHQPIGPVGPAAAETNDQIMTASAARDPEAYQILSRLNWADTVWADNDDLCHLRITDLNENGISFYWHTRSLNYPNSFQSELCTTTFADDVLSCNYTDDWGNTGLVRLVITDQSISFEQTVVHSGSYSPEDLRFTLLPRTSGTAAMYFEGSWKAAHVARRDLVGQSSYYGRVSTYIEQVLGITDISGCCEELLETDTRFYTEAELSGYDKDLIRIFKNEIYARHGYQFTTPELYAAFMDFTWYYPDFTPDTFKESVFNQYEKENLKLLTKLEGK